MRKPASLALVLVISAALATPARALNIDSAFQALTSGGVASVNKAGAYSSSARTTYVLGGVDARMPSSRVTLMSVTPPSVNAGCNGISAHFGGFSFVSGAQIETLINNISANATGMVIGLVLKTLCPICEGVISAMTKMAQDAAKLSIDSCHMADNLLARGGLSGANGTTLASTAGETCGKKLASGGDYPDVMAAMDAACSSMSDAVKALEKYSNKPPAKDANGNPKPDGEKQLLPTGNITWELLKASGYGGTDDSTIAMRTLMMNLIGTTIVTSKNADGTDAAAPVTIPAAVDADRVMDLFMCGTGKSFAQHAASSSSAAVSCRGNAGQLNDSGTDYGGDEWMYECPDNDLDQCLHPVPKLASEMKVFADEGFLFRVSDMLNSGAEAIRKGQDLSTASPNLLNLMSTVPYPVYQIINVAAIYPVAAHDLIDVASAVIADAMTASMFESVVRRASMTSGQTYLSLQDLQSIQRASEKFQASITARKTLMVNRIALQEAMMENIRSLNLAIQKDVLGDEMLGTSKFANSLNSATADPSARQ